MRSNLNRREMLGWCAASASALCLPGVINAKPPKTIVKTFTYKTVDGLEIKADVHRADDNKTRPVMVWFHGGALIVGHRGGVSGRVLKDMLGAGYAVVSFDYRLAPETKLPGIISDLEDGFTWLHQKGPELFNVDTSKVAVSGGSAGGCMTMIAGYRAKPRPTVLVPFWGYGDLIGDWIGKPSPHKRHQTKFTKAEAYQQVSGPPIADSRESKKKSRRLLSILQATWHLAERSRRLGSSTRTRKILSLHDVEECDQRLSFNTHDTRYQRH